MTDTVEDLVALMDLERLELDLFRGTGSGGETSARIFGAMWWRRRWLRLTTR